MFLIKFIKKTTNFLFYYILWKNIIKRITRLCLRNHEIERNLKSSGDFFNLCKFFINI